jgi:CRISPR/Cas system-associated endonuclease Cas1
MPTACLNQPNIRVHLTGERLEVYGRNDETDRDEVLREIPLRDLDRLIASESVHFTSPALGEILRRGIPIQFFSWRGQFLGNFLPAQNHHGLARLNQYRRTLDPTFALQIAGRIVTAKLYNQRRVLQRLDAGRADEGGGRSAEGGRGCEPTCELILTDHGGVQRRGPFLVVWIELTGIAIHGFASLMLAPQVPPSTS